MGPTLYIKDTTEVNSRPWKKSIIVNENGKLIEKFEKDSNGNDIYYTIILMLQKLLNKLNVI